MAEEIGIAPGADPALGRGVLVVRAALRRGRILFHPHPQAAVARASSRRSCRPCSTGSKPRRAPGSSEDGFAADRIEIRRIASLHYQGQSFELRVPVAAGQLDMAALSASRRPSGSSTSAPTATAPGPRSRSNWSASKSSAAASPTSRARPRPPPRASRPTSSIADVGPPRLFRPAPGLAGGASRQPQRPQNAARRPLHRRGIRRNLPGTAGLDGAARRVRQHRADTPLATARQSVSI